MWKMILGPMVGALGGAVLTAVVLLEPNSSATTRIGDSANSHESTSGNGQLTNADQTPEQKEKRLLGELQILIETMEKSGRSSPATATRLKRLFETLVFVDPIATAELIADSVTQQKFPLSHQFLGLWVERHGFDLIHTLPANWPEARPLLYRRVLQNLGNEFPEETLAYVLDMPPSDLRPELMVNTVLSLGEEAIPEFFLALTELTDNEQRHFVKWDSISLANKAPGQLLAWSSILSEPQRSMAAQSALEGLARLDPKAALERIDSQPANNKRRIIRSALQTLAATEPQLAIAEAETREDFFVEVATVWANRDPEAATAWLMQHTPDQRSSSHDPLRRIASRWSKQDLNAALAYADTLPEGLRAGWTSAIAAELELTDLDRLETLAQTLSDTPYAAGMYQRVAFQRYESDPKGTLSQLLGLKPELRDEPLSSILDYAMEDTPDSAARLINQITDEELRMRALRKVLPRWQSREDGAMERWLANEASPSLRDEAYAALASDQPRLITSIEDRELRVATYLALTHRSRTAAAVKKLLAQIELSEAQWDSLDNAAIAGAK